MKGSYNHQLFLKVINKLKKKMILDIYTFLEKKMAKADWLQENSGGIFVQWRCDLHDPCEQVPDDPGYCPQGCTYMMGKFNSHLFSKYKNC